MAQPKSKRSAKTDEAGERPKKRQSKLVEVSESEDQSSPEPEDQLAAAQNLVSNHRTRRNSMRGDIETEHKKMVEDLRARMDDLFASRKEMVTAKQRAQLDRLDALNKKRENLESLILSSMKTIEISTRNMASEMNAMLEGRIDELETHGSIEAKS